MGGGEVEEEEIVSGVPARDLHLPQYNLQLMAITMTICCTTQYMQNENENNLDILLFKMKEYTVLLADLRVNDETDIFFSYTGLSR